NIWSSPKTSITGLLIATVTIARVFSQQGITLGTVGNGTVISLLTGLATALLGLLARDPDSSPTTSSVTENASSNPTTRVGCWALIALLLLGATTGCSAQSVAQNIVNWTPTLQSAVATVDATAAVLDPAAAPVFTAATVGFDAASNTLVAQAKAYLANPSAGVLAQLQTAVITFQQQVNVALLQAAKITNPASQQKALADINVVATAVNAILALINSISSKAAVAQMAAQSTIKLASIEPLLDKDAAANLLASHYGEPVASARMQLSQAEVNAAQVGF
ncbi:MAG: hypothetical protein WB424_12980, partial [Terracidiphilus sp.]